MSDEQAKFAKIALPKVHSALPRPRLFALIDHMRQRHPVLWIASPPGAGKTTLAASYIAAAQCQAHWCQIDQGDGDPATLFFFLSEAIRHVEPVLPAGRGKAASGRLDVERLFFRDFYARLPTGAIVVFDNIHDFDWASAGSLMEVALSEVPEGITLIALSRDAPPPRLARLALSGKIGMIGWDELRLDADETRALAGLNDMPGATGQAWLDLVDGWVAGIVLLRTLQPRADALDVPLLDGREAVFRYFAGEIFERMAPAEQHALLLLSCLPGISEDDARQLTGSAGAGALLCSLYRDRLFVERRGDSDFTYHFHALFREFLQHEARLRLDSDERLAMLEQAARILDRQGRIEDAAQLFQDAAAHGPLSRLLLSQAAPMFDAGRGQTWRQWLSAIPPERIEQEPWLSYWHGLSLMREVPMRARSILHEVELVFSANGDLRGQLLALLGIVDSYDIDWGSFRGLTERIAQINACVATLFPGSLDAELDLKIHSRLVLAMLLVAPDSPSLGATAEHALRILPLVQNHVEQLAAGAILLRHFDGIDQADTARRLVADLNAFADDPAMCPFHRVKWYDSVAKWYSQDGHFQEAGQFAGSAKQVVANFGLDPLLFQFLEVHHLLCNGELEAARALLEQIAQSPAPKRMRDLVELRAQAANLAALSGDIDGALEAALEANRMSAESELPRTERARLKAMIGAILALQEQFGQAEQWYLRAADHAHGYDAVLVQEARQCVAALACAAGGDDAGAIGHLSSVLGAHRERRAATLFVMLPQLAARLAALALRHGVEVEHVRKLILHQRLNAPNRFVPHWPWPVSVRVLGPFELSLNGAPVRAAAKGQRPSQLLMCLVDAGEAGKNQRTLASQLWPDADDGRAALNVTIHRLRKMLDCDNIITVTAGKIQLATDKLWTDIDAMAQLCKQIEAIDERTDGAGACRMAFELLDLYRAPFCDGDDALWVLPIRERWRNRFLAAVSALGARLEALGQAGVAADLYRRALEAEPLAEASYRGLMRCAHAHGDSAAAFSAYRRCRETMSILLGRKPSSETERLAVALGLTH